jgi:hypothetical protein
MEAFTLSSFLQLEITIEISEIMAVEQPSVLNFYVASL